MLADDFSVKIDCCEELDKSEDNFSENSDCLCTAVPTELPSWITAEPLLTDSQDGKTIYGLSFNRAHPDFPENPKAAIESLGFENLSWLRASDNYEKELADLYADLPLPDPCWDYFSIWEEMQKAKADLERLLSETAKIETATKESDRNLKLQLKKIILKLSTATKDLR